jgi:hypothetical protein
MPPGEILVGGSGELVRTQILPLFSLGSVEEACPTESTGSTKAANTISAQAQAQVLFICPLYLSAQQI